MACKLCADFRNEYPLQPDKHNKNKKIHVVKEDGRTMFCCSPIQCAFEKTVEFTTDNWSCQTLCKLRDIAENNKLYVRDDLSACSIGIVRIPDIEDIQRGYIVMTWYKDRGCTGQAWVMCDDADPQPLTLKTAEKTIESYGRLEKFKEESQ